MRTIATAIKFLLGGGLCAAPLVCVGQTVHQPLAACAKPAGVQSLQRVDQLPKPVRQALSQDAGELSPIGGPFDATDVVIGTPHFRRLVFLWHHDRRWLAATERGGIAYSTPLYLYELSNDGNAVKRLQLAGKPRDADCDAARSSILR